MTPINVGPYSLKKEPCVDGYVGLVTVEGRYSFIYNRIWFNSRQGTVHSWFTDKEFSLIEKMFRLDPKLFTEHGSCVEVSMEEDDAS